MNRKSWNQNHEIFRKSFVVWKCDEPTYTICIELLGVDTFTGISAGSVLFGEPLETLRDTLTQLTGLGPSQDQAPHIVAAQPATGESRHSNVDPAGFLMEIDY